MKRYRPWTPDQVHLFPPAPRDWLADDHLVFLVLDIVDELDISGIEDRIQSKDPRGTRPYSPRMMLGLLILGYCLGIRSSRKLEKATYEIVPFRLLTAGHHPDHTRISEFRRVHLDEFKKLFKQVLKLCQKAGLVKLGHVSLDGSKFQANASKHKAMSYQGMQRREKELQEQIEEMVAEAEQRDQEEDALYGPDKRGDELPEELRDRQARLKKIEEARKELEAEAAAARARERQERAREKWREAKENPDDEGARRRAHRAAGKAGAVTRKANEKAREIGKPEPDLDASEDLPSHQVKSYVSGKPKPKAQRNFTDPDSRVMKKGGAFLQGYNCQLAVDEENQIIVAEAVTNQAGDTPHFLPLMDQTRDNTGQYPEKATADSGFCSDENIAGAEERGIDAYIATGREKHGPPDPAEEDEESSGPRQSMEKKLSSEENWAIYRRRKCITEPVFGQIKAARRFRQFLLRGLEKVRGEWALNCLAHNLLKLAKAVGGAGGLQRALA